MKGGGGGGGIGRFMESLGRGFEGLRGSCGGVCGVGGVAKGIIVESRLGYFFTNSHFLPKWLKIEVCKYCYWNPHCLVHQKPFF